MSSNDNLPCSNLPNPKQLISQPTSNITSNETLLTKCVKPCAQPTSKQPIHAPSQSSDHKLCTMSLNTASVKLPLTPCNTSPATTNSHCINSTKHHTISNTCPHCSKVYAFKSGLSKHLRKEHGSESQSGSRRYILCNQCQSR